VTTLAAPAWTAPWTALIPMPPRPWTITVSPGWTSPVFTACPSRCRPSSQAGHLEPGVVRDLDRRFPDYPCPRRSPSSGVLGGAPEHLPHGRSQVGDRHLKFHETRDNLRPLCARCLGRPARDDDDGGAGDAVAIIGARLSATPLVLTSCQLCESEPKVAARRCPCHVHVCRESASRSGGCQQARHPTQVAVKQLRCGW
jgi:hypothetical protein